MNSNKTAMIRVWSGVLASICRYSPILLALPALLCESLENEGEVFDVHRKLAGGFEEHVRRQLS